MKRSDAIRAALAQLRTHPTKPKSYSFLIDGEWRPIPSRERAFYLFRHAAALLGFEDAEHTLKRPVFKTAKWREFLPPDIPMTVREKLRHTSPKRFKP